MGAEGDIALGPTYKAHSAAVKIGKAIISLSQGPYYCILCKWISAALKHNFED